MRWRSFSAPAEAGRSTRRRDHIRLGNSARYVVLDAVPLRFTRKPTPNEASGRPWRASLLRAINPDGTILWPGHNDLESYRDIHDSGGSALFMAIWLQDPSGLAGEIFHAEWFQDFAMPSQTEQQPSKMYPGTNVTLTAKDLLREGLVQAILPDVRSLASLQASDLAISAKETADFYARLNCWTDREGNLYIHDAFQARAMTDLQMVEDMARAGRKYRCSAIGIESNAFQSLLFQQARRAHGGLPWVELDPAGRDKVMRARPFADHFERSKVFMLYGARWSQTLRYQYMQFPGGAHDDLCDAGSMLFELALRYSPGGFQGLGSMLEELRKSASNDPQPFWDR